MGRDQGAPVSADQALLQQLVRQEAELDRLRQERLRLEVALREMTRQREALAERCQNYERAAVPPRGRRS